MASNKRRFRAWSTIHIVGSLLIVGFVGILHGATDEWTSTGLKGIAVNSLAVNPAFPKILYAGTRSHGVYKTADAGLTWMQINNGLTALDVLQLAIDPINPQTLYAGTYSGSFIYKTTDGGQNWKGLSTSLPSAGALYITTLAVDPLNPQTVYAGFTGVSHGVIKTTDGGENWSSIYGGRSSFYLPYQIAVDPKDPQTLYLAVMSGPLKSSDGGRSWNTITRGIPGGARIDRIAVDPVNPKVVYAALGTIYKSTDAGQNWAMAGIGLPSSVNGISVDPKNTQIIYAIVQDGAVYRTVNGGQNWVPFNNGLAGQTVFSLVVDPQNTQNLYAGSQSNGVYSMTCSTFYLSEFYFPQVGNGGYFSNFILVNPDNTTANATLELFKPEGTPLRMNLNGTTGAAFSLRVPAHGVLNLRSPGTGDIQMGWAQVRSPGYIKGAMIYGYTPAGITSEEAGINPAVRLSDFRAPVDNRNGFSSGIAVANPNAQEVALTLILYSGNGSQVRKKEMTLPAMNQIAGTVEKFFPEAVAGFTGMLTIASSGGAVAGTTLRYNATLSALASTPVIPSSIWPSYPHFAQIADGGGYKTTFVLLNLSRYRLTAQLETFKQDGTPWNLSLNGEASNPNSIELPVNGLLLLESPNSGSSPTSGWARLTKSNGAFGGSIIYSYQGKAISEAGTGESVLNDRLYLPVDTRNGFYTGAAIANPNSQPVTLDLHLYDRDGNLLSRKNRALEGMKQMAELDFQLFPEAQLADFTGLILINSTGGQVIGTVLRFNLGSTVFSSMP